MKIITYDMVMNSDLVLIDGKIYKSRDPNDQIDDIPNETLDGPLFVEFYDSKTRILRLISWKFKI